ncbi:glycosyltransferase family 2 protein [Actinomyces succiniciruminis]|uniref:Glycosyltransferase-like 2 n=1 Tax=Actinomyces succiniciruminis TaxID=1522002 RepID=A0A1L7RKP1_9ACTO|nr:glycosyltransferase [Actinomyces succiniciruminis]CED92656.1 Glycosyltransferase-like 2 [Actinomyces succiniciruminis]
MHGSLTIAVLTYRRNAYLVDLIPRLLAQARMADEVGLRSRVLVIDNDPGGAALPVIEEIREGGAGLDYVHEPVPGIVAGRNRALSESVEDDLLVFIDDDELPGERWITALLKVWERTDAAAVTGPTPPRFDTAPDPWVRASGAFDSWDAPDEAVVLSADTGNLLLDLTVVRRLGLAFDPRYGLTGGEDSLFTRQLTRGGGRIRFAADAVVVKRVPDSRACRGWVLRRTCRAGSSWARVRVDTYEGMRPPLRLAYAVKGVGRAIVAGVRALSAWARGDIAARAAYEVSCVGGLGMVLGAFGMTPEEYGRG